MGFAYLKHIEIDPVKKTTRYKSNFLSKVNIKVLEKCIYFRTMRFYHIAKIQMIFKIDVQVHATIYFRNLKSN